MTGGLTKRWLVVLMLSASCEAVCAQTPEVTAKDIPDLTVRFHLPLSQRWNGVDGELQLLEDARITPALQEKSWLMGPVEWDDDTPNPIFKDAKPRNALIQIVDQKGAVLASKELERPMARLATATLYGGPQTTYLLTVDYSAGFGSYSGPTTFPLDIRLGQMHWLEALYKASGKKFQIILVDSLKTQWILFPSGKGAKDILEAACRPRAKTLASGNDFTVTYMRFHFDGKNWVATGRTAKGFAEFEDGFPSRGHFR